MEVTITGHVVANLQEPDHRDRHPDPADPAGKSARVEQKRQLVLVDKQRAAKEGQDQCLHRDEELVSSSAPAPVTFDLLLEAIVSSLMDLLVQG